MIYSNDVSQIALVSRTAADFIAENDLAALEPGRYPLSKNEWVNIEEYTPWPRAERRYESHRAYIDIQMIVAGAEYLEVAPTDACEMTVPYNDENDCANYSNATAGEQFLLVPGRFIAVYPEDAHMPGIAAGSSINRKAVFKIHV